MKNNGLQLDLGDMFEHHEVFDIPKIVDYPAIKLFTKLEIEHINSVLDKIHIDKTKIDYEDSDYDEVQDMLNDIKDCFKIIVIRRFNFLH